MRGRLITAMLLTATALILTACAVPEWLFEPGEETTAGTEEPYPALPTVAATGTPIDAVGVGPLATITLPAAAGDESTTTSETPEATPAAAADELCVDPVSGKSLSYDEAVAIAAAGACTEEGELLADHFCNVNTGSWWIGLDVEREGCYPACAVDVSSETAEINWRCAGAPATATTTAEPVETTEATATSAGAEPFTDWQGFIYRQPSGSLVEYRFRRDDGEWFDIGAQESEMRERFAATAWAAVKVVLSGKERVDSRTLEVQRLVELPLKSDQPRNLTPFAMPETSSRLAADEGGAYFAWSAVDGSLADPWCEGAAGPGSGEWLQLDFSTPLELTEMRLANGYQDGEYLYVLNNRVKTLSIYVDGELLGEWALDDSADWQSYAVAGDITPGVTAGTIRLVIEEEFEGWSYEDTCIAEVEVWGKPR